MREYNDSGHGRSRGDGQAVSRVDIHAAALAGDVEKVRQYIDDGGDPNQLNAAGITPLHR